METRTQHYAKAAYPKIEALQGSPLAKKYGPLALKFPALILQAGLAQATGFLLAKGKEEHLAYLGHLADIVGAGDGPSLHRQIIASPLADYQRLTRRALDAAGWLKRYAQGLLGAEATAGDIETADDDLAGDEP